MSLSAQRAALESAVEAVFSAQVVIGEDELGNDITEDRYTIAKTLSFWPVSEDRVVVLDTQLPLLAVFLADGDYGHRSGGRTGGGKATMAARFGVGLIVALAAGAQGSFAGNFDTMADEVTDLMEDVMLAIVARTDIALASGVQFSFAPDVVMLNNGQPAYSFLITAYESKENKNIAAG